MVFLTFALTPFALALMALAPAYQAKHMVCTWKPGIGSPNQYKYEKFCNAPVTLKEEVDINTGLYRTIGTYSCTGVHRDEPSRVADWNVLRDNILNFGTPCGDGGWYVWPHDYCPEEDFAICLGANSEQAVSPACWYVNANDDCEWPDELTLDQVPSSVDIWYKPT